MAQNKSDKKKSNKSLKKIGKKNKKSEYKNMAYKMTRNHNKYLQIFEEFDREKKKNFFWHKTDDDGKQEFERE